MNILVIEDRPENINAAKAMLAADHQLTVVSGYDQAHELLFASIDTEKFCQLCNEKLPEGWKMMGAKWVEIEDRKDQSYLDTNLIGTDGKKVSSWDVPHEIDQILSEAEEASKIAPFDVILTDVMIPKGGQRCMSSEGILLVRKQGEMPYGPVIALRALQTGVKKVGVITSGDHHSDPFIFAFDGLYGFKAGDVNVVMTNNMDIYVDAKTYLPVEDQNNAYRRMKSGEITSVKNWTGLLQRLL